MHSTDLFTENRAASPVLGVILMVAITVILAAVIGTFVLSIAPSDDPAPTVYLTLQEHEESANVTIRHGGGSTIDLEEFTILVNGDVENESMTGSLRAGERAHVEVSSEVPDAEVTLRHDPSGSIMARANLDLN